MSKEAYDKIRKGLNKALSTAKGNVHACNCLCSAGGLEVKALEWEVYEPEWHVAKTPFNFGYEVRRTDSGGTRFRFGGRSFEQFVGTFEEAKAHCQADYESRIRSGLVAGVSL